MPACSDQRKRLSHRQATSSPATSPHLVVGNGPPAAVPPSCPVSALHLGVEVLGCQPWVSRYRQNVPTGHEHLSEDELFERACARRDPGGRPQVEFLGAFSIDEALEMGAWFDDPDERAAFERAGEPAVFGCPDLIGAVIIANWRRRGCS